VRLGRPRPRPNDDRSVVRRSPVRPAARPAWTTHCKPGRPGQVMAYGQTVTQTAGDLADPTAFLQDRRITEPSAQDLLTYPDLRTHPAMVSWPPARTAPCWCGSSRKYKQCCRPHSLGTLD